MTHPNTMAAVMVLALTLIASACSKPENQSTGSTGTAAPAASTVPVDVTLKTDPDPVKAGENTLEVMVMQDGKPVNDAQVSVEFQMPAMPQMKMAEMKTKADLMPAGDGRYRGQGQVMMAGNWNVTVMAMRGGQELATKKLALTAK